MKRLFRKLFTTWYWNYSSWYRDRYGIGPAMLAVVRLFVSGGHTAEVSTPAGSRVTIRPGTADMTVFDEIFFHRCYELKYTKAPDVIIDAGGHIGLASVYFSEVFPDATIISVEPEPANFSLLVENTRQFPNVKPVSGALWSHDTTLAISNPAAVETWSWRFSEATHGIPAYSIDTLMKRYQLDRIDILKMDIEGAEVEVLKGASSWISKVKVLLVELHDRYRPGCREALDAAIASEHFLEGAVADFVVCSRPGSLIS